MNIKITSEEDLQNVINSAADGDTVYLSAGKYIVSSPIKIENRKNISIIGDNSVISGAITLSGEWKPYRDGIYVLETEKGLDIQAIYINGDKYIMARYPNEDRSLPLYGGSADAISKERAARWNDPTGGYVRALHNYEWGGLSYHIDGKDDNGELILRWVGDNYRGCTRHKDHVMVENIFEELDSPMEWFYDKKEGLLYVYPESGTVLGNVEAAIYGEMFKIENSSNITVSGITFDKTKRMLFCSEYRGIIGCDWTISRNGAVYMKNCENVSITSCRFTEVGGNCIFINEKNENILVENCDFTDCGASGICIFGDQNARREFTTTGENNDILVDMAPGPKTDNYPRNITVKSCYFRRLGIYEKQSSPVSASVASRVTVDGCTMHDLPRAGLNVCDGTFGGHKFINNLVYDTVKETSDHGPFNSWGRDRFYALLYNPIGEHGKIKRPLSTLDACETTVIAHNMFCGTRGFGIDLDDGSSNYLITKNYCIGAGIKLRDGFIRRVTNNFLLDAHIDLHCTYENNDDIIENNIIISEKGIVPIHTNKGFTTYAANNLFVGTRADILDEELLSGGKNYVCEKGNADAMAMKPKEIYFEPLSLDFGRPDKPKPNFNINTSLESNTVSVLGADFSVIDDSVRSAEALPSYDGVYVAQISEASPLFTLGLRKEDIIKSVNGNEIKTPNDMRKFTYVKSAEIIRGHRKITL